MTESEFTRWFCKALEKVNCVCVPIVGSMRQQSGIPDRWVAHSSFPQKQVWLEFKKNKTPLSGQQEDWFADAERHGVDAMVVRWANGRVYFQTGLGTILGTFEVGVGKTHGTTLRGWIIRALGVGVC